MIFAFLPTAVVFFAAMFFFGAAVALLLTNSLFGAIAGLSSMLLSLVAETVAIKGSHKLYMASMAQLPIDYDGWLSKQRKILNRSYGAKRMLVLCNLLYGTLAYEQTETAMEYLEMLRSAAEKKNQPMLMYHYAAGLLSVKEKKQDLEAADTLLAQMYDALNHPKFPGGEIKAMYVSRFEYNRLKVEFYKRTPEQLRTTDKHLTEQMIASSRIVSTADGGINQLLGYTALSCYYNAGLSYVLLGQQQEADRFFEQIIASGCGYPLVDRVKRYRETQELSMLFEVMP